jgi:hypothetical protein
LAEQLPHIRLDHITVPAKPHTDRKKLPKPPKFKPDFVDHGTNRASHAKQLNETLNAAQNAAIHAQSNVRDELRPTGFSAVAISLDDKHHLQLAELQKRAQILQFRPPVDGQDATASTERAVLWVSGDQLSKLASDITSFADKTKGGNPRNQALAANISTFQALTLQDLWRDESDLPVGGEETLWELWYEVNAELESSSFPLLDRYGAELHLTVEHPVLQVGEYISCVVEGTRENIEKLLNTRAMPVEVRKPSFMEELETLGNDFLADWVDDFSLLVEPAPAEAPAVTVLDNGIKANHPLLAPALEGRAWSVVNGHAGDDMFSRHGTQMAGVAVYGDLRNHLDRSNGERLQLTHGLEAVRVLRRNTDVPDSHRTPGILMVNAVAEAEIRRPETSRVFLLAQTMTNRSDDEHRLGLPTTWSIALDALAMGCGVEVGPDITRVGRPEPGAQRLFCVSIGNVRGEDLGAIGQPNSFPATNMTRVAEDPSQAWNVLRIGAFTELEEIPTAGHYDGWQALAQSGGLSPYSRTGVAANNNHGAVPDIVLEGGNLLSSPSGDIDHPSSVSIITTSPDSAAPLTHTFATSAGTAQAARLAAMIQARYPNYWAETVRGLMVHRARWTDHMATGIHGPRNGTSMGKGVFDRSVLRMYGWGVPRERELLNSEASDVTTVIQDKLKPFDAKPDPKLNEVKFYKLPWSQALIEELGNRQVELRITLSYFVEPNPGKRGANHHSTYPSHGLQFLIKSGTQSREEFRNDIAQADGDNDRSGATMFTTGTGWVAGKQNRDRGSLRSDMWRGPAYKLMNVDEIAVVPLTGWWKLHRRRDRCTLDAPFSLIITLRTLGSEVDLYTNIAASVGIALPEPLIMEQEVGQLMLDI